MLPSRFKERRWYGVIPGEEVVVSTAKGFEFTLNDRYEKTEERRKRICSIRVVKEYLNHILFAVTARETGETWFESLNKVDLITGDSYFQIQKDI